ncbi:PREDICTED: uncharacterized protein LOC109185242 [Ipomoea nil]|uniref:uncharacterized protein LOC109185242 n=1 Tax=Ipomoea nil TaxID=35883 RepID=UPI0009016028|nr:PREDICTED: uncharacterized protein LOC109185242 [Ipomoea nil]
MAVQGVLKEGCRRVVGNGADTIIGLDPWLPDDNNPYVETELHQSVFRARVTSLLNDQGLLIAGLGIGIRRGCILLSHATNGLPWLPRMIGHGHVYGVYMFPLRLVAESAVHLFVNCAEARRVWNLLGVPQLNAYAGMIVSGRAVCIIQPRWCSVP